MAWKARAELTYKGKAYKPGDVIPELPPHVVRAWLKAGYIEEVKGTKAEPKGKKGKG